VTARWFLTVALTWIASAVAAHPANLVSAVLTLQPDGAYRLIVRFDLPALLANERPAWVSDDSMRRIMQSDDGELEDHLRSGALRLQRQIQIDCGNSQFIESTMLEFPSLQVVREWGTSFPLMQECVLGGELHRGASHVSVKLPDVLGDAVFTLEREGEEPFVELVSAGGWSSRRAVAIASSERPVTAWVSISKFIQLGFIHILPRGFDHILFIAGLFLLSQKLKPLIWQVTAFTAAHTISLAMAMLGVVQLPASVVEPLIAASIAFIAVENLFTTDLKPWRPAVVFGFGLIHGLGFAGILREMQLPHGQLVPALLSFNVGVELGQLAVLAMLFFSAGWFRSSEWYRPRVAVPASIGIACIAAFWTVQRLMGA
jgi:hypothetical protein